MSVQMVLSATPPQRSWKDLMLGRMKAENAWTTYSSSISELNSPLILDEEAFYSLPIKEMDQLARSTKQILKQYSAYEFYMDTLRLPCLDASEFAVHSKERREEILDVAQDTSEKWPAYRENMLRMGRDYEQASSFHKMTQAERKELYDESIGTKRNLVDVLSFKQSASDGWSTYQEYMGKMGQKVTCSEYEFIHLGIDEINVLSTQAKKTYEYYTEYLEFSDVLDMKPINEDEFCSMSFSERCELTDRTSIAAEAYIRLVELCNKASMPAPLSGREIYDKNATRKQLREDYKNYRKAWASRVVYNKSCQEVGAVPNWEKFEKLPFEKQAEASLTALVVANNYEKYQNLCVKLDITPEHDYLQLPPIQQKEINRQLSDTLWEVRKEKSIVAGKWILAIVAFIAVVAIIIWSNSESQNANIGDFPKLQESQIDRDQFRGIRENFWKGEAEASSHRYSSRELECMQKGKAPIGIDGFPMELHHPTGSPLDNLIPMTRTEHRLGDNYKLNHPWLFGEPVPE